MGNFARAVTAGTIHLQYGRDGRLGTRITVNDMELKKGVTLIFVGLPDGVEPAPLDYISLLPARMVV